MTVVNIFGLTAFTFATFLSNEQGDGNTLKLIGMRGADMIYSSCTVHFSSVCHSLERSQSLNRSSKLPHVLAMVLTAILWTTEALISMHPLSI